MGLTVNVLGLDGSLQNFGLAVVTVDNDSRDIVKVENLVLSKTGKDGKAKRADDDFARFSQHWTEINAIIKQYDINIIFGEIPSGSRDVRAAFAFGGVTAMLAGLGQKYTVKTVTPSEVKVAATGNRHADKEDVIVAMHKLYPDAPWITSKRSNKMDIATAKGLYLTNDNEHLADAISVVIAGLKK